MRSVPKTSSHSLYRGEDLEIIASVFLEIFEAPSIRFELGERGDEANNRRAFGMLDYGFEVLA